MDKIKQVGKYLDRTVNNSSYAIQREAGVPIQTESIRDYFDPNFKMHMLFPTYSQNERVKLGLIFIPTPQVYTNG